jgi:spermidine synthase
MGNTAYSLATILTVFMGGLALGSYLGGRFAPRVRNVVRVYGLLEIFIGLYCALIPWGIDALQPLLATVYRDHYSSPSLFGLIQFSLCGLVLLFPTILMGVTLPLVAGYAARRNPGVSWTVGLVYGMNTLGAFLGVMVGGFLLIPHIGLSHSNLTGVALSVGVGVVALVASFRMNAISDAVPPPAGVSQNKHDGDVRERSDSGSAWPLPHWLLLLGFGVSGFAAMSYQVGWTRIVTLSVGSATYAFTLIVGAFILGLALGAPVIGRLGDRRGWSVPLLIGCQLGQIGRAHV